MIVSAILAIRALRVKLSARAMGILKMGDVNVREKCSLAIGECVILPQD
jgi:hypothetical protein